eukprot:scaffold26270_cov60-Attheya_sp.AAC.12
MMAHHQEKVNKNQRNKQQRQGKYRGRPDERKHIELIAVRGGGHVKSASLLGASLLDASLLDASLLDASLLDASLMLA